MAGWLESSGGTIVGQMGIRRLQHPIAIVPVTCLTGYETKACRHGSQAQLGGMKFTEFVEKIHPLSLVKWKESSLP